jgi:hypothetical protein
MTTASPIGQRIAVINIIPLEIYGLHYDKHDMINYLPIKLEDIQVYGNTFLMIVHVFQDLI